MARQGRERRHRSADPIVRRIDAVRRALVVWTWGWGYLWVSLLVVTALFAGVLIDHGLVLQRWGRLTFFHAFTWSAAGAALLATLSPLLRRTGRLYVARRMEVCRPELKNTLISYLECRKDPAVPLELRRLMRSRAAVHVRSLDARVAVDPARYVRLAGAVAAVLAAFALYALISPKSAGASVRRLMNPRADILPPTATRLVEIAPGDVYAIVGSAPAVGVTATGVEPAAVDVIWDGTTFSGRRLPLVPAGPHRWEGAFPPLLEDGQYHLVAGDTRSERFAIRLLPVPAVADVRMTIAPPAYTGLPVQTVDGGSADVVQGTEVTVEARTNLPARAGFVQFAPGRRLAMDVGADRRTLRGRFFVRRSERYSICFETPPYPNGASFANPSPVVYELTSRPDRPPTIELLAPEDGLEAKRDAKVLLGYAARDDFGIARVNLHYRANGMAGSMDTVAEPAVASVPRGAYEWDLAGVPLRPGSVLAYCLEAVDNRPDRPQTVRTEERRILVPALPARDTAPTADSDERSAEAPARQDAPGGQAGQDEAESAGGHADALTAQARRIARALAQAQETAAPRAADEEADPVADAAPQTADGQASGAAPADEAGAGVQGTHEPADSDAGGEGREDSRRHAPEFEAGDGASEGGGARGQARGGRPQTSDADRGARSGGATSPGGAEGGAAPDAAWAAAGECADCAVGERPGGAEGSSRAGASSEGEGGDEGGPSGTSTGQGAERGNADPGASPGEGGDLPGRTPPGDGGGGGSAGGGGGVRALPEDGPPEPALSQDELDRAMEAVARMLRDESLPGGLLKDLGMEREELRRFVEHYRAAHVDGSAPGPEGPAADQGRVVYAPEAAADGVRATEGLSDTLPADVLRSRFEDADGRLAPRYRDVVQQYYRTLSEIP
ncbi:MAG: hypothetical protein GXY85_06180 [Candidatus Brocadiaceae bacterium]|nr:hypothetical protein [Candidatus Brocadiaceae bacterium]